MLEVVADPATVNWNAIFSAVETLAVLGGGAIFMLKAGKSAGRSSATLILAGPSRK